MTFFSLFFIPFQKIYFSFKKNLFFKSDDTQYRRYRLFLLIPITTDYSNNRPDYVYSHYISTTLHLAQHLLRLAIKSHHP